ncbi:hypothetical protein OGZ51_07165 [Lactococcus lactis]|uniref:Uncharacterized protein n=1 Tax=Lactococcus lactis TaxID=1358 RepID=A0A9X4NH27_9LACT|nr:hypothetical protein [Lactococcus lactis]MDG4983920.1 hypothetical protein [Lactococcus lactis]
MAENKTKMKNLLMAQQEELGGVLQKLEGLGSIELNAGRELGNMIKNDLEFSDSHTLVELKKKSTSVALSLRNLATAVKSAKEALRLTEEALNKIK